MVCVCELRSAEAGGVNTAVRVVAEGDEGAAGSIGDVPVTLCANVGRPGTTGGGDGRAGGDVDAGRPATFDGVGTGRSGAVVERSAPFDGVDNGTTFGAA
jgi:hypothetical protein